VDNLLKAINQYPNGTDIIVEWEDGYIVSGIIDTIYETDNELDPDEKAYQEFYVCLLFVNDIIEPSNNEKTHFSVGDFIEISMQKPPLRVCLKDKTIIWEQSKC